MTIASILIALSSGPALPTQTKPVDKVTLEFSKQSFTIRKANTSTVVGLSSLADEPKVKLFRKNDVYAVWDARGLSTRAGGKYRVTRYPEIAVSPRTSSRNEILHTLDLIRAGKRTKNASAISGSVRFGSMVYFLLRWDEPDGSPWLEALVRVNLDSRNPEPQLVGKFTGISLARRGIGDSLTQLNGKLFVVTRQSEEWGVASYDPKSGDFDYLHLGDNLVAASNPTGDVVNAIEKTPYGATVALRIDLQGARRRDLIEGRETMAFLDSESPEILVRKLGQEQTIYNSGSGATLAVRSDAKVRRVGKMVLVWSPAAEPRTATLYDPDRWVGIASWTKK